MAAVPYAPSGHYVNPLVGTLAELAMRNSAQRADGIRRSGEIVGSAWQNIGNTVAGSLANLAKARMEAPERAQEQQARNLEIQAKQGEIAAQQRQLADAGEVDTALGAAGDDETQLQAALAQVHPRLRPGITEAFNKSQAAKAAATKARTELDAAVNDWVGADAYALSHIGADKNPEAVHSLLTDAKARGLRDADGLLSQLQQDPTSAPTIVSQLVGRSSKQREMSGQEADRTLRQTTEQRMAAQAAQAAADKEADNKRADALAAETGRHNLAMENRPVAGAASDDEAEAIADAIIRGEQSPETTGLYRVGPLVRASLAKKGYNQAQAVTDWRATQKHVATLNGAQQTRMAQSIDNAAHSLDVIDTLADQWKAGRFPLLNRARIAAAKQGALGPDAQKIAVALDAQIADVTSELGNVYMGGNSPTDHALGLASKNLSGDWSNDTLRAMTAQARKNLTIRGNSMKNVGVMGASANNQYAPPPAETQKKTDPLGIR